MVRAAFIILGALATSCGPVEQSAPVPSQFQPEKIHDGTFVFIIPADMKAAELDNHAADWCEDYADCQLLGWMESDRNFIATTMPMQRSESNRVQYSYASRAGEVIGGPQYGCEAFPETPENACIPKL